MQDIMVKKAKKGDKDSFSKIIQEIKDQAYRVAYCYLHNEEDSMDAVCDAIEKAYNNINKLKHPKYFKTWFIRIVINECKKQITEKNRVIYLVDEIYKQKDIKDNKDDKLDIEVLLKELPELERSLIYMKYYLGYTLFEISEIVGLPEGTVKSKIYNNLKKMKTRLDKGGLEMKEYKFEELDNFIEKVSKKDIEIPEGFDKRIDNKIEELKPKKKYKRNILVSGLCFFIVFLGLIRFSDVGIYAAEISILEPIVELIRGDKGIENAVEHGYKEIPKITIKEDGYIITLDDIYMDEDRISFTSIIEGPAVDVLEKKYNNYIDTLEVNDDFIDSEESSRNKKDSIESKHHKEFISERFEFTDFEGYSMSYTPISDKFLGSEVENIFREIGKVEEFLKTNPKHLNLDIKILVGKEVIKEFNNIKIPIEKENIKLSKKYNLNQNYEFDEGTININELNISPTRMRLDLKFYMDDSYFITGFDNPHIKDSKGNIYKPEGLTSLSSGTDNMVMYFVPSVYFEETLEALYFCFDGIRIGSEEGREFRLALEEDFPKTIEYMGEEILIDKLEWKPQGELEILYRLPSVLKLQNIGPVDNEGYRSMSEYTEIDENGNEIYYKISRFPTKKQEYYDLIFEFPGYLISNKEKIELKIK